MSIAVSFMLKEPQVDVSPSKQKEALVYIFFNYGYYEVAPSGTKKYFPLKYSSGIKIKPCYWNGKETKPNYRVKQSRDIDYKNINVELDNIEGTVKKVFRELSVSGIIPSPNQLREAIDVKLKKKIVVKQEKHTLNTFIRDYIEDVETGHRLTDNGQKFKPGTIKNLKGFLTQFLLFQEAVNLEYNFDDITLDFYDRYVNFFVRKNYSPNTIGRHVKNLKSLMREAREEGHHSNVEIEKKKFKTLRIDVQNIYLNSEELKAIFDLDLTEKPTLGVARDIFLIGCYTAQRFSDYGRITKDFIKEFQNGVKVIDLIQQKTGEQVIIPIRPELEKILQKYDYTPPKTYEQKVNQRIKEVAKLAGLNDEIVIEEIKGGIKHIKKVPKYELIKTHTARRSGASNMYLAGIPTIAIMKITGHKTEREFLKYIKLTKEETAQSLANHPYFT